MTPHVAADSTRPTTFFTVAAASRSLPGLRVLSRASSSTPSAMNRACDRHTGGFDLPDRRTISAVPQPSAVARSMAPRHTCFCGGAGADRFNLTALNCFGRFENRPNESDH